MLVLGAAEDEAASEVGAADVRPGVGCADDARGRRLPAAGVKSESGERGPGCALEALADPIAGGRSVDEEEGRLLPTTSASAGRDTRWGFAGVVGGGGGGAAVSVLGVGRPRTATAAVLGAAVLAAAVLATDGDRSGGGGVGWSSAFRGGGDVAGTAAGVCAGASTTACVGWEGTLCTR